MINSIKYFEEECIKRFEKLEDDFMKEPQKLAEYYNVTYRSLFHHRHLFKIFEQLNPRVRRKRKHLSFKISFNIFF